MTMPCVCHFQVENYELKQTKNKKCPEYWKMQFK